MGYEHKNNRGSLFKNDERQGSNSPHLTGTAKIDGIDYRIAAWHSDRRPGMITLWFETEDEYEKRKQEQTHHDASKESSSPTPQADFDDDIPF